MAERAKIEEHRDASAGLPAMDEGSTHEGVGESVGAIGRVRDDVFGKRPVGFQKVLSARAKASVDEVGGNHVEACGKQYLRDRPVAACRLPNAPLKGLDREKSSHRLGWGRVKVVRHSPRIAIIQVRKFCFYRVFLYNLWVHRMMMKK